jgi:hypothetical protein
MGFQRRDFGDLGEWIWGCTLSSWRLFGDLVAWIWGSDRNYEETSAQHEPNSHARGSGRVGRWFKGDLLNADVGGTRGRRAAWLTNPGKDPQNFSHLREPCGGASIRFPKTSPLCNSLYSTEFADLSFLGTLAENRQQRKFLW